MKLFVSKEIKMPAKIVRAMGEMTQNKLKINFELEKNRFFFQNLYQIPRKASGNVSTQVKESTDFSNVCKFEKCLF